MSLIVVPKVITKEKLKKKKYIKRNERGNKIVNQGEKNQLQKKAVIEELMGKMVSDTQKTRSKISEGLHSKVIVITLNISGLKGWIKWQQMNEWI